MVHVPADTPVTIPEFGSTVAREILLLLHVPAMAVFVRAIVCPWHKDEAPDIAPGMVVIDTGASAAQIPLP
jgi:hypothetical protein